MDFFHCTNSSRLFASQIFFLFEIKVKTVFIQLVGLISGVNSTLLGITFLAWGNSANGLFFFF